MSDDASFRMGWNTALERAAYLERLMGFRVTAARLQALKMPEPVKAPEKPKSRLAGL